MKFSYCVCVPGQVSCEPEHVPLKSKEGPAVFGVSVNPSSEPQLPDPDPQV